MAHPEVFELPLRVRWFVKLRFIASFGVLTIPFISGALLNLKFPKIPVLLIGIFLLIYNSFFFIQARKKEFLNFSPTKIFNTARLQIALDFISLMLLLYFSGGIENPFRYYFIFHVVISSLLFSRKESIAHTTFAFILYSTMAIFDAVSVLPHFELKGFSVPGFYKNINYISVTLFVFGTTLYFAQYFTSFIAQKLEKERKELQIAYERLKELDKIRAKTMLLITHELRAPLSSISCLLNVLTDGYAEKEAASDFIRRAKRRSDNLLALIDDLLYLAKLEQGQVKLEREPILVEEAVQEVVETLKPWAESRDVKIEISIPANLPKLFAEKRSVDRIFTNLISNAIKYNKPEGKVWVSAHLNSSNDFLEFQIKDTGTGIKEMEISKIFDLFYQGTEAKKMERRGAGLGLSLCKTLVEIHQGKIWAESNSSGSIFYFTLPVVKE